MKLTLTAARLAVCRLAADATVPPWAGGEFTSITRTPDELSVVCEEAGVPAGIQAERGWRAFRLEGPIPFEVTGVAASLTSPLAANGISLFLISTYDTDWLLVKEIALDGTIAALGDAGFEVATPVRGN